MTSYFIQAFIYLCAAVIAVPLAKRFGLGSVLGYLIAGIGRFGQIVNRLLVANSIETIVLDHDAKQVDNLRKLNTRAYFGDATRPDLLESAGIDSVDLVVIAIDDREKALELTRHLKHQHPG